MPTTPRFVSPHRTYLMASLQQTANYFVEKRKSIKLATNDVLKVTTVSYLHSHTLSLSLFLYSDLLLVPVGLLVIIGSLSFTVITKTQMRTWISLMGRVWLVMMVITTFLTWKHTQTTFMIHSPHSHPQAMTLFPLHLSTLPTILTLPHLRKLLLLAPSLPLALLCSHQTSNQHPQHHFLRNPFTLHPSPVPYFSPNPFPNPSFDRLPQKLPPLFTMPCLTRSLLPLLPLYLDPLSLVHPSSHPNFVRLQETLQVH